MTVVQVQQRRREAVEVFCLLVREEDDAAVGEVEQAAGRGEVEGGLLFAGEVRGGGEREGDARAAGEEVRFGGEGRVGWRGLRREHDPAGEV